MKKEGALIVMIDKEGEIPTIQELKRRSNSLTILIREQIENKSLTRILNKDSIFLIRVIKPNL